MTGAAVLVMSLDACVFAREGRKVESERVSLP